MTTTVYIILLLLLALAMLSAAGLLVLRYRRTRAAAAPAKAVPSAPSPYLESPDGSLYFPLHLSPGAEVVVGRGTEGVDISIPVSASQASSVSLRHARIYFEARCGHAVIEDLGSTNGILVNGRRAPRKNLLRDRWTVTLGGLELVYRDGRSDTGPLGKPVRSS